jgi:hypothetical protein
LQQLHRALLSNLHLQAIAAIAQGAIKQFAFCARSNLHVITAITQGAIKQFAFAVCKAGWLARLHYNTVPLSSLLFGLVAICKS